MKRKKSKEEIEEERDWALLRDEALHRFYEKESSEEAKLWDDFAAKQLGLRPKKKRTKRK